MLETTFLIDRVFGSDLTALEYNHFSNPQYSDSVRGLCLMTRHVGPEPKRDDLDGLAKALYLTALDVTPSRDLTERAGHADEG